MRIIKLQSEKCKLAIQSLEDAEKNAEWLSDAELSFLYGVEHKMFSAEKQKKTIQAFLEAGSYTFAILDEKDEHIGNCEIWNISYTNRVATIGLYIGNKKYRHKGYGTDAINLMLRFCFETLNLNNVGLTVFSYNTDAIKCYKKIGFREYGVRHNAKYSQGKYYDEILMEYLAEQYYL